ncbi:MAG: RDD family protein [Phycisphaeraceae bacterium JB051]
MREIQCTLCKSPTPKYLLVSLYNGRVCQVCRTGFEFRRSLAFLCDYLLLMLIMSCLQAIDHEIRFNSFATIDQRFLDGCRLTIGFFMINLVSHVVLVLGLTWHGVEFLYRPEIMQLLLCRYLIFPLLLIARDGISGRSIGKRLFLLQVLDSRTGKPIGIRQSMKRNLWLLVPLSPLLIWTRVNKGFRMGDQFAKTMVIDRRHLLNPVYMVEPHCTHCHYDLTANTSGVCPECGMSIREFASSTDQHNMQTDKASTLGE